MSTTEFLDLSLETKSVFLAVLTSIVGLVVTILLWLFRKLRQALWKAKKTTKTSKAKHIETTSSAQAHVPTAQPHRHSVPSHKKLVQQSKTSRHKKQDEGRILDHPLYIIALKEHRDVVNGFAWASDGSAIASACEDRSVRVFTFSSTIDKGINTKQINVQGTPVDCGFINNSDNLVVLSKGHLNTASLMFYRQESSVLNSRQWTCTKTIEKAFGNDPPLRLESVTNPNAGKTLIIACSVTKEARVYDANGNLLSSFAPNSFVNHDLAVSHNGELASVATFTADAKVWALKFMRDGTYRDSLKVMDLRGHLSKVMSVAFSMDASKAVSVSQDGVLKIWNVAVRYDENEDPRCLLTVKLSLNEGEYYHRLAFGPDDVLAAAIHDSIHFINVDDGALMSEIEHAHDEPITSLHWSSLRVKSRKGMMRVLASSSKDKRIRLWAHPKDL